ncbi:hypothetical protein [Bacillus cereus]|uniref:HNH endonuclease n=1 Tax=Bacillus cereus TaxID=1396 RepID=UPI003D3555AF
MDRLLKGRCKQCGSENRVHMHYVKKLKGLKKTGKAKAVWFKRIIEIKRKTSPIYHYCHIRIIRERMMKRKLADS